MYTPLFYGWQKIIVLEDIEKIEENNLLFVTVNRTDDNKQILALFRKKFKRPSTKV